MAYFIPYQEDLGRHFIHGLTPVGLSYELTRFYARNGFYATDSGLYWNKKFANLETITGVQLVTDAVISQANITSVNDLLDVYLAKLVVDKKSRDSFSEKDWSLIESWVKLRQEIHTLGNESEKYDATIREYEHQQRMADLGVSETVGI